MKISTSLCLFTIAILLSSSYVSTLSISALKKEEDKLAGIYKVQMLADATDPFETILESEYSAQDRFVTFNPDPDSTHDGCTSILITKADNKEDIVTTIEYNSLYDQKVDNADAGQCCVKVEYKSYPANNRLRNLIPVTKVNLQSKKNSKKIKKKLKENQSCTNNKNPLTAVGKSDKKEKKEKAAAEQHCITLREDYDQTVRICNTNKELMDKVNLKVNFCIIKNNIKSQKVKAETIISKMNLKSSDEIPNYDWDTQDKWQGRCNKEYMQSPINIISSQAQPVDKSFALDYRVEDSEVVIKKGKADVVTTFLKFPGIFNLGAQGNKISYMPVSISYRFPGEVIIDGVRSEGDLVLNMQPIANRPVS